MSTILGVGIDLCELDRIEDLMRRMGQRFLQRLYNPTEIDYVQSGQDVSRRCAGLFAGKEAVVKCLGTGFSCGVGWKQIEVRQVRSGWSVVLHGEAARLCANRGASYWLVDIHYSKTHAAALALWRSA